MSEQLAASPPHNAFRAVSERARDIPSLTVLRIFAALLVVFSHQFVYWNWTGEFFRDRVVPVLSRGDVGVKIFFILSGFILTHSYAHQDKVDKHDFFLARFARIYPMYLFGLFLALPMLVLIQVPEHVARYGTSLGLGIAGIKCICVLLLLQSWIPPATDHWNGVSWSLSTEAFFYSVFPWVMPWMRKLGNRALWSIIGLGIVLETVRTMSISATTTHQQAVILSFFPILRLTDFLTGIAICLLHRRGRVLSGHWVPVGLALLVLGAEIAPRSFLGYGLLHIGSGTLVASLASSRWSARSLVSRTGVLLGQASYTTYLIHQPLGFILSAGLGKFAHAKVPYPVYLVVLLGASCLLYVFVETPCRRWIRARYSLREPSSSTPGHRRNQSETNFPKPIRLATLSANSEKGTASRQENT
jgi:peptidoglycan/LPS O-acetylase OafA/YrhL